jgi:hypothetical protein
VRPRLLQSAILNICSRVYQVMYLTIPIPRTRRLSQKVKIGLLPQILLNVPAIRASVGESSLSVLTKSESVKLKLRRNNLLAHCEPL